MRRDHYGPFDNPVLAPLPDEPPADLFTEFDEIATELRAHPKFIESDLQIAFRQLQRVRLPNLSRESFLYAFEIWCDHDRGQQVIDDAERAARFDALCDERRLLFTARALYPGRREAVAARLAEIGRELAELQPRAAAPLGEWG